VNATRWPAKVEVLGVGVSVTDYDQAVAAIMAAAARGEPAVVTALPVHGIVTVGRDRDLRRHVREFELVVPDGQPVRWAMNWLHEAHLADRVYGPELMLRLCARAAEEGVGVYLYGSHPHVLERLRAELLRRFPSLPIAGVESPPFRPLTPEEDRAAVERIEASGARLVFLGLGCPRQDEFAAAHRTRLRAVQVCVGAAFDFHSGNKPTAPAWLQRRGLEWAFRLTQEPGRLWRRYLFTNTAFSVQLAVEIVRDRGRRLRARLAGRRRS
jgi:exopolysaccharide biosynthesis WecB/TagA/CpsF family protein